MTTEQVRPTQEELQNSELREGIGLLQLALRGAVLNNIHFCIAFQTKINNYVETGKTQIIGRDTPIDVIVEDNIWRYEHCAFGESKTTAFEREMLSRGTIKDGQITWERSLVFLYSPPIPVVHFEEGEREKRRTHSNHKAIQKGHDLIKELNNEK